MTRLFDDATRFADEALEGFLDLHDDRVMGVPGGVVRRTETRPGKVAVVVGGGSGHYPAFCGVVGPGFADGAVVGNVFTSPSTADAVSVGRAAAADAGLLFSTGNYAGDVMNFTMAQHQLVADGLDTRVVFVTDDIASAPVDQIEKRRGIAGDFVVFKVAGAAAEAGYDLDGVERVARLANARTRTLGVAFAGCTLPGADAPLFAVPEGQMGVGLGIHGEPGISEQPMPTAAELADTLVTGVLAEAVDDGRRVAVILNGLGATKYEELFAVWRSVSRLLVEAGYTVVDPEVGELVTSLDMAGCSLTLVFLDEELERLWRAPADTPAYRRGSTVAEPTTPRRVVPDRQAVVDGPAAASEASRRAAEVAVRALALMQVEIDGVADELGRIDAVAGDGDHGRGMLKGVTAAAAAARESQARRAGVATVLSAAGEAWGTQAGGTSGVLWGAALTAFGRRLGDEAEAISPYDVADAVDDAATALRSLGRAEPGDKTMLDALLPFADELRHRVRHDEDLGPSWAAAAEVGRRAADATARLRPRIGRARPLAERSLGTPDAGAVSLALCLRTVADTLPDTLTTTRTENLSTASAGTPTRRSTP